MSISSLSKPKFRDKCPREHKYGRQILSFFHLTIFRIDMCHIRTLCGHVIIYHSTKLYWMTQIGIVPCKSRLLNPMIFFQIDTMHSSMAQLQSADSRAMLAAAEYDYRRLIVGHVYCATQLSGVETLSLATHLSPYQNKTSQVRNRA